MFRSLSLSLSVAVLSLGSLSCAQVTGHVRGDNLADFFVDSAAPADCTTKVSRLQPQGLGHQEEAGVILVEGGIWITPAEMDEMLRAEGCKAGASELVVLDEGYGQPFVGSWARAAVLTRTATPDA